MNRSNFFSSDQVSRSLNGASTFRCPLARPSKLSSSLQLRPTADAARKSIMYAKALTLARNEQYDRACKHFEGLLLLYPTLCKGWVAYAQMIKRQGRVQSRAVEALMDARVILHRGMKHNPTSACLAQTWGLTELQLGNVVGASKLLERAVRLDPKNYPVLKWKPVISAMQDAEIIISSRWHMRRGGHTQCLEGIRSEP